MFGSACFVRTLAAAALVAVVGPAPSTAQIPEEFENLRFFPEDISRGDLIEEMRQFSFALGVRCTHCHVADQDNPNRVGDYASDAKNEKVAARRMLRMVKAINTEHLTDLPEETTATVSCATCHGGVVTPRRLEDELEIVRAEEGMAAAVARYGELREHYYGRDTYDFSLRPLMTLGERLVDAGLPSDAVTALELNRGHFPESLELAFNLAKAYRDAERIDDAVTEYRRVIEMSPDGGWAKSARKSIDELAQ